ncbi:hypothetical protein [Spirobacillus cienkowskii]|jgi:hypothetical protein|uniref:Uncharacterized protein n=1 Tax=Spirobacillus cienkowskii TaxID=495820 RepID=A0A369KU15_9BACT|nr:MAG: hypothetical protein DCC88_05445 [Spirobacillus cienkowskii]
MALESSTKFKIKDKIVFSRGMEVSYVEESIHRCLLFALNLFEKEGLDTPTSYLEAHKVIFAHPSDFIGGSTIAQWIAAGGDERKAYDAMKDYIIEAKKIKVIMKEVKTITARVFKGAG